MNYVDTDVRCQTGSVRQTGNKHPWMLIVSPPSVHNRDVPSVGAQSDAASSAPIDRAHLAKFTFGDPELEAEVVGLFATQVVALCRDLRTCRDSAGWAFLTHSLKGSARAVGAWRMAELAKVLEANGFADPTNTGLLDDVEQLLQDAAQHMQFDPGSPPFGASA